MPESYLFTEHQPSGGRVIIPTSSAAAGHYYVSSEGGGHTLGHHVTIPVSSAAAGHCFVTPSGHDASITERCGSLPTSSAAAGVSCPPSRDHYITRRCESLPVSSAAAGVSCPSLRDHTITERRGSLPTSSAAAGVSCPSSREHITERYEVLPASSEAAGVNCPSSRDHMITERCGTLPVSSAAAGVSRPSSRDRHITEVQGVLPTSSAAAGVNHLPSRDLTAYDGVFRGGFYAPSPSPIAGRVAPTVPRGTAVLSDGDVVSPYGRITPARVHAEDQSLAPGYGPVFTAPVTRPPTPTGGGGPVITATPPGPTRFSYEDPSRVVRILGYQDDLMPPSPVSGPPRVTYESTPPRRALPVPDPSARLVEPTYHRMDSADPCVRDLISRLPDGSLSADPLRRTSHDSAATDIRNAGRYLMPVESAPVYSRVPSADEPVETVVSTPSLASAERLRGASSSSSTSRRRVFRTLTPPIDSRLVTLLPSINDISIEGFIDQVELLFSIDQHRMLAVRAKLPEEYTYFLRQEEDRSWEAMRAALLSRAKRATPVTLMTFNRFTQGDNETINAAWERMLQLVRAADIRKSKHELWDYFRDRLTQTSRLLFRGELKQEDPYVALPAIAQAGDIPVTTRPSLMVFQPQEGFNTRLPMCWNCGKDGHIARSCPNPSDAKAVMEGKMERYRQGPPQSNYPYPPFDSSRGGPRFDRGGRRRRGGRRQFDSGRRESPAVTNNHEQRAPTVPPVPTPAADGPRPPSSTVNVISAFQPIGTSPTNHGTPGS